MSCADGWLRKGRPWAPATKGGKRGKGKLGDRVPNGLGYRKGRQKGRRLTSVLTTRDLCSQRRRRVAAIPYGRNGGDQRGNSDVHEYQVPSRLRLKSKRRRGYTKRQKKRTAV